MPDEIPWPAALALAALFWTVFVRVESRARRQAERGDRSDQ